MRTSHLRLSAAPSAAVRILGKVPTFSLAAVLLATASCDRATPPSDAQSEVTSDLPELRGPGGGLELCGALAELAFALPGEQPDVLERAARVAPPELKSDLESMAAFSRLGDGGGVSESDVEASARRVSFWSDEHCA